MVHTPERDEFHTAMIHWRMPISTSPLLSDSVQSKLQFLQLSRLTMMITQYSQHIRSVVRGIVEANQADVALCISPVSVESGPDGMQCSFSIAFRARDPLWKTLQAHIEHTLEGLHQSVCVE